MPTVVIATLDIGGNVPPMLGIARELQHRGWHVLLHGEELLRARAEEAGATFVRTAARQVDPLVARTSVSSIRDAMRSLTDPARAEEVRALVQEVRADVALVDVTLVRVLAACAAVVPTVALVHTMFDLASPFLGPPGKPLLDRLGMRAPGIVTAVDRLLVASPSVLDGTRPLIANAVRVGAVLQESPTIGDRSGVPLVLVSLSSAWFPRQERLLQRIVDAVAGLRARVVVTTGRSVPPSAIRAPEGVAVHAVLDHGGILRDASLVIGHGGHATTVRALAHGVPMVVLPLNPASDQRAVARAVARSGAGLVVPKSATVGRVRAAAATVLRHPAFAAAAATAGVAIRAEDGARRSAEELERLVLRG